MAPDEDTAPQRRESNGPDAGDRAEPTERMVDDGRASTSSRDADLADHGRDDGSGAVDGPRRAASVGGGAVRLMAALTGHRAESVISIERADDGWRVGVEVVEASRIPDSADILAVYEVRLDADGELRSYQRVRRYARGDLEREPSR